MCHVVPILFGEALFVFEVEIVSAQALGQVGGHIGAVWCDGDRQLWASGVGVLLREAEPLEDLLVVLSGQVRAGL